VRQHLTSARGWQLLYPETISRLPFLHFSVNFMRMKRILALAFLLLRPRSWLMPIFPCRFGILFYDKLGRGLSNVLTSPSEMLDPNTALIDTEGNNVAFFKASSFKELPAWLWISARVCLTWYPRLFRPRTTIRMHHEIGTLRLDGG